MFFQQNSARIDTFVVLVCVAPAAGDVEILHREAQRVDARVTPGAGGVLAVCGEFLADRQVLRRIVLVQRRYVVRRRRRGIVENDFDDVNEMKSI